MPTNYSRWPGSVAEPALPTYAALTRMARAVTGLPDLTDPACVTSALGPDAWFPAGGELGFDYAEAARPAIAVCNACPAVRDCLEWVLVAERGQVKGARAGIYGGTTPHARWVADGRPRGNAGARGARPA